MGTYIQGPKTGKARYLTCHGAEIIGNLPDAAAVLNSPDAYVCVVSNTSFDAALLIRDRFDLMRVQQPDSRPKVFLRIPRERLTRLTLRD